jgi:hypothetical protein
MSTTRGVAEQIVATLLYGSNTDYNGDRNAAVAEAIDKALQAERERAAKIAEIMAAGETYSTGRQKAINIAAAIREGKPQK